MIETLLARQLEIVRAFPEIAFAGHPALRAQAEPVSLGEGREISARLQDTLVRYRTASGMGVGLAAPQLGLAKAVFVTFLDGAFATFLNPVILPAGTERNVMRELCLSSGIMWCEVVRPAAIQLRWTDEEGVAHEERFDDRMARVLQHEADHLRGILNLDRAEPGTITFLDGDPKLQQLRPA